MNLAQLEQDVFEKTQELGRMLLEAGLKSHAKADGEAMSLCYQCGNHLRIQKQEQVRRIRTRMGEIEYRRAYGVCDRCGHSGAPLDWAMGIPGSGPSVGAREKISHAAVVGRSFEDGREILEKHTGIVLSRKRVRELAEEEGARLIQESRQEVKAFKEGLLEFKVAVAPSLIVVTCDGGRIQTRLMGKDSRWKEDKIGAVYDAIAEPCEEGEEGKYQGAKARIKSYVATMENWESLGYLLRVEAERRGYEQSQEKVFVADGAQPIREIKRLQFPDAVFILDRPHALGHLSDCAKAAFGEGTRQAMEWYLRHKQMLWDGKAEEIRQELERLSEKIGPPLKEDPANHPRSVLHQNAYSYFPNNKEAMDYPRFRARGWPIGSGVAEGAVKQFSLRMKGSEKFWNISNRGADEMLALCSLYHSEDGRWQHYWNRRAEPPMMRK